MSSNVSRIPESRLAELRETVKQFYGVEHVNKEILQQAINMETEYAISCVYWVFYWPFCCVVIQVSF